MSHWLAARLIAILALGGLFYAPSATARVRSQGDCMQGGHTVSTGGVLSTTTVMQSYASCTVTVFLTGTVTPATLFADNLGTPKANPFTADSTGHWFFYADNNRYDVQLSGAGITVPFTLGDVILTDPTVQSNTFVGTSFSSASTPVATSGVFNLASADIGLCWRNNANSTDLCLTKNSSDVLNWPSAMTIQGNLGLSTNRLTAGGFTSANANPATTGTERYSSTDTAKIRNNANSADLNLWSKNASDVLALGDAAGISVQGSSNSGNSTVSGTLAVSGAASLNGGGTLSGTFTGNPTLSGNPSLTGTVTESGATTVGKLNNTFTVEGVKYAQTDTGTKAALSDCATQGGGIVIIPSGVTITKTTQWTIGSASKAQCFLQINPGASILENSTGGTDSFLLGDGSGVVGLVTIDPNSGSFPANVRMNTTTNIAAMFAPLDRTGGQEGFTIRNISVHGSCSATLSSAIFDIQGLFSGTRIEGVYTDAVPGKVVRIRPATAGNKIASDIIIDGNLDATNCAGGQPISIEGATGSEIATVTFSGHAQHAGNGLAAISINGAGVAGGTGVHNIHFVGAYHVETQGTPGAIAVSIADASHVVFDQLELSGPTATTVVDISQTAGNITHDIEVKHIRTSGAWTNTINNHISTYTSGSDIDSYVFGSGAAGAGGAGIYVFDTMPIGLTDGSVTAPGLGFRAQANTGMWRPGANQFGIAINGVSTFTFLATGTGLRGGSGEGYCFSSNVDPNAAVSDTCIGRAGAAIATAGNGTPGNTSGEFRSSKIAATFNSAGTLQTAVHIVQDTCTLGTNCGVTLTGSAAFTNATSYTCTCQDNTAAAACRANQTAGNGVTFTGTGTDVLRYICIGN